MRDGLLTVLIADDEAPARSRLRELLKDTGGWIVCGEAGDGETTLALCQQHAPDIVLLDIRMPGMDGIEAASHLAGLPVPPAVIFVTAYDEYAISAFDAHAVAYLLKPVRRERLLRALEHAARLSRMQLIALTRDNPELGGRQNIPVSLSGNLQLVPVDSVIAFHADQKYVRMVHAVNGNLRDSLIDEPLKSLEAEFAAEFVRIHRGTLVRARCVDSLQRNSEGRYELRLRGSSELLPVSRRHAGELKERLIACNRAVHPA